MVAKYTDVMPHPTMPAALPEHGATLTACHVFGVITFHVNAAGQIVAPAGEIHDAPFETSCDPTA
jgi:hypothetical protein